MRKKKWVTPYLKNEDRYLLEAPYVHDNGLPLHVEIGMGMGDFINESALLHPEIYYIGLEREETCVARAIRKAKDNELENFKVLWADAAVIDDCFAPASIDVIYLHFSDPWPKKRNHKRRLTYPPFLKKYEKVLKDQGELILKTDNEGFFDDSLEYFKSSSFRLVDLDRNYYVEGEPMTAYQARFVSEGKPIYYAKYVLDKV